MVDLLLSKGASPKAIAPFDVTALHLAAVMGSSSVVQVSQPLISASAFP